MLLIRKGKRYKLVLCQNRDEQELLRKYKNNNKKQQLVHKNQ